MTRVRADRASAAGLLVAAALGACGCGASSTAAARRSAIEALARTSRERGAYRCAPEELALADAHLAFAGIELRQGDLGRAREHLVLADLNARAALRLSEDAACAENHDDVPEARADAPSSAFAEMHGLSATIGRVSRPRAPGVV